MEDAIRPAWPNDVRRLRIGDVWIDVHERRVAYSGYETELPQRMFDLLLVFASQPNVLLSRAELFARVWPGVIVEDANLTQSVWMLRKALGESRKRWIRTVAKRGYVFEPPAAVEAVPADALPAATALADTVPARQSPASSVIGHETSATEHPPHARSDNVVVATPAEHERPTHPLPRSARPSSPSPPRARPRGRRWSAALVLVLTAAGALLNWHTVSTSPARQTGGAQTALAIALIDVEDDAMPQDARWPVRLLHAWLAWKLDNLPEVALVTEAHLATDASSRPSHIVFLSSSADSAEPDRIVLRARLDRDGAERRYERKGPRSQLPALTDQLSQDVLAELLPARATSAWPQLALNADSAQRYVDGLQALKQRNWTDAAQRLQDTADHAPAFGLVRFQLGEALSRLSRAAPAIEQTQAALKLLQPLPPDVARALQAEALARDPQKSAVAAQAFADLAAHRPDKRAYLLKQSEMLIGASRPKEALALLNRSDWSERPLGEQLRRRLTLAAAYHTLGDGPPTRENALAAERMAAAAGLGWEQERGEALLLQARADTFQYQEQADLSRYEQAARQFESAGNELDALRSRFLAASRAPGPFKEAGLDALLAQARSRGYLRLETDMLRFAAYRHYERGDLAAYRARLAQARATAEAAGDDRNRDLLELDLLNEDMLRGRLDRVDLKLTQLRTSGIQGNAAIWLAQFDALAAIIRGQHTAAEAILDAAERRDRAANPDTERSTAASRIACVRADVLALMGAIDRSRSQWKHCASSGQPFAQLQAQIGTAAVDTLAGDRAAALAQLRRAEKGVGALPDGPDRWLMDVWLATQLTRAGDAHTAERLYRRTLPLARAAGYDWIVAMTDVGLAETAAVRGDWPRVRAHMQAARRVAITRNWTLSNRLDMLDAVIAMSDDDRAGAMKRLAALHAQARQLHDTVTQMEVQSLLAQNDTLDGCNERCRIAMAARTGLRGATLDWLVMPARRGAGLLSRADAL